MFAVPRSACDLRLHAVDNAGRARAIRSWALALLCYPTVSQGADHAIHQSASRQQTRRG